MFLPFESWPLLLMRIPVRYGFEMADSGDAAKPTFNVRLK
jgi:hypothetical protein